ncbi:tetratricopeptide repeat protein [Actinokineospora sp. PR83]|nr:tetratricopeptide repeat protein [Actinokineospora sp. PR83]
MGLNALASALYGQKRHQDALAHYHRALDLAVRAGYRLGEANIHNNIAQVHRDLGDLAEAVAPQARAVDMFREVGDLGFVGLALANLAELEHGLGHLAPARAHATEAITLAATNGLELTEAFGREVLARVLREEGDLLRTRVELEKAVDLYRVAQSPLVATVQERLDTLPAV